MASNMEDRMIPEMEMEVIRKDLLRKSVKGEWAGVVDIYEKHPHAHEAKLTRNEDTALHMAISNDKQETVKQLMNIISSHHGEGKEAPEIKNRQGNTPLHVAASMGSVIMCESIAGTCQLLGSSFIAARNCKGETPLFLAVLCGKKDVFLYLHNLCQKYKLNGYDFSWRSDDDDTILHAAITVEHFDLAFQIIHLYPKLVDSINKQGFSPLHLLADKPSTFKSATIFALIADYIIYKVTIRSKQKQEHTNLENLETQNVPHDRGQQGFLIVPKQKYKWVTQVMNELVERTLVYELANGGMDPNMIIRLEMVGDPKQKTPIIGNNSGKGWDTWHYGSSPGFLLRSRVPQQENDANLFYACQAALEQRNDVWFLDSRCSNHMTVDETIFVEVDTSLNSQVEMVHSFKQKENVHLL